MKSRCHLFQLIILAAAIFLYTDCNDDFGEEKTGIDGKHDGAVVTVETGDDESYDDQG